jgi:hypothetical protein
LLRAVLSYCREDTQHLAGRHCDRSKDEFGSDENVPVLPHVYGPIEMSADIGIGVLGRDSDGSRDFVRFTRFLDAE